MAIDVPNLNSDCCGVMKSMIPTSVGAKPTCGGGDLQNCKNEVCSKCSGQGPDAMKKGLASNCSATEENLDESIPQFVGAPFLGFAAKVGTQRALRLADSTCGKSSDDCKIAVPEMQGVNADLVLKTVSPGCCSVMSDATQDILKLLDQLANNHTMPKPGDLPVADLKDFCSKCASEKNQLLSMAVTLLKQNKATKEYCAPNSTTTKDFTV